MFNSPRNENFNLLVQIKSLNIEKVKKKTEKFTGLNKVLLVLGLRTGAHP